MIAPDANLLIYAYAPSDPHHEASRAWLEEIFSSSEPVGIPVLSVHAFMRVTTHPMNISRVLTLREAGDTVNSWLALPHVRMIYPGVRHWQLFQQLAGGAGIRGADLTDAAVAAIALEHGAIVHTNDRDFARFPNLRWHNPLH